MFTSFVNATGLSCRILFPQNTVWVDMETGVRSVTPADEDKGVSELDVFDLHKVSRLHWMWRWTK